MKAIRTEKTPHELAAGEFCKWNGVYYAVPPGTDLTANLRRHKITEHADGSITVEPSILVSDGRSQWHGFLEGGQWKVSE